MRPHNRFATNLLAAGGTTSLGTYGTIMSGDVALGVTLVLLQPMMMFFAAIRVHRSREYKKRMKIPVA